MSLRGFGSFGGERRLRLPAVANPPIEQVGEWPIMSWPEKTPYISTNLVQPGMQVNDYSGLPWGSGSAGQFTPSGDWSKWRGRNDDIFCAHSDNNDDALELWWSRFDGYEYATAPDKWNRHYDISIGAFGKGYNGNILTETWKGAGRGDYDQRWADTLISMRAKLHGRLCPNGQPPKVFIRFAHEWNGNWYPWSASNWWLTDPNVTEGREVSTKADFKAAWVRFRALQRQHYPEAFIVCNVNRTGEGWSANDDNPSGKWSDFIPDPDTFDVYGLDYYNWWKPIYTQAEWDASLDETYSYGDAKGLRKHQELAVALGKPMSYSEWGGVSTGDGAEGTPPVTDPVNSPGDSPLFIENMFEWFKATAGTGPGQCLYECYWNVLMPGGDQSGSGNDKFHLFSDPTKYQPQGRDVPPQTKMPESSHAYRDKWYVG